MNMKLKSLLYSHYVLLLHKAHFSLPIIFLGLLSADDKIVNLPMLGIMSMRNPLFYNLLLKI